jgi:hypothetical protein
MDTLRIETSNNGHLIHIINCNVQFILYLVQETFRLEPNRIRTAHANTRGALGAESNYLGS